MPINWNDYEDAPGYGVAPKVNLKGVVPAITRGAGALLPGGPIGAAGNFLLEGLAQGEENLLGSRQGMNASQLATQAGLGAIPFGKAASLLGTLGKGALLGAGGTLATQQAETGLHTPTTEELQSIGIGGALGAGTAGLGRYIQGRVKPGEIAPANITPTPAPAIGNVAARTGTAFEPGPIPSPIMKSGTIEIKPQEFTVASPTAQGAPRVSFSQAAAKETPEFVTGSGLKGPAKKTKGTMAEEGIIPGKKSTKAPTGIKFDKTTGKIDLGTPPKVEVPAATTPVVEAPIKTKTEPHPVTGKPVEVPVAKVPVKGKGKGKAKLAAQVPEPVKTETPTKVETPRPKLPEELSKSSPRYSIGEKKYELEFADDVDKALYIVGGKGESKSHQKFKDWLIKTVGMNEGDIANSSKLVRAFIKNTVRGQEPGKITLPRYNGLEPIPVPKGQKGIAHEMAPRKPRGITERVKRGAERMFYSQKSQVPPNQQIPISPNKVTIPGEGSGTTAPVVMSPWQEFKKMSWWGRAKQLMNEQRQAQTTGDLSFGLRQGIGAIHTKEWRDSLQPMWEAAKNQGGYDKLMSQITGHGKYQIGRNAGLEIIELPKDIKNVAAAGEGTRGTLLDYYVPPVAASNRAYTAMSNKLRMDLFSRITGDLEKLGVDFADGKNANARAVAELINDMTGRGKLPFNMDRAAEGINHVFFSPKLIASRLNMFRRAFADPRMLKGADDTVAKALRKEAWKSMGAIGSLAATGATISALMFNQPSAADITSADFGKIRTGNTRIDLTGGFQQYVRTAAQLAQGMAANTGLIKSDENTNVLPNAIRFGRAKLAPLAATLTDMMAGKDVVGEEFGWGKEAAQLMQPLVLQDLEELIKEDPGMALQGTALSAIGAGVQSYPDREVKSSAGGRPSVGRRKVTPRMFKSPKVKLYQPGY